MLIILELLASIEIKKILIAKTIAIKGGKILSITQSGLDRIIIFEIENINDFGDYVKKELIVELMGKYSNVIFIDEDKKIIDSMRHVTNTMSSIREVLPGKNYVLPSSLGKSNILNVSLDEFITSLNKNLNILDAILEKYIGISKTFLTGICNTLNISLDNIVDSMQKQDLEKIHNNIISLIKNNHVKFELTSNQKDYYILEGTQDELYSEFLDRFYTSKEQISILKNAKQNIEREINSQINKIRKKLANVNEILADEKNMEIYKQYGELISCNIYKMQLGMDKLITENFYNNNEIIEIPLQINLTPSRNAQLYFKKYNKLKNSIIHAKEYKKLYENDISYLESVLYSLSEAETINEVDDIRDELISINLIKKQNKKFKRKDLPSEPIKYEKDGIEILVGRNNIQNDKLTFKIAKKTDTWLHTKNIHGSHVIIKSNNIPDNVLLYAAQIAAKHSKAKDTSHVEVDYTLVKYVHKENGSKPGMVVYTDYNTIIV